MDEHKKNPHAVALGKRGKGKTSPAKAASSRENARKALAARMRKRALMEERGTGNGDHNNL